MAKTADQFRQSDVVLWGLVALASAGMAVVAANLSTVLPPDALRFLHSARLDSASIERLADRTAALERETRIMRQSGESLRTQFDQQARQADAARRRIGALEVSLPRLIESIEAAPNAEPQIDRSLPTASIAEPPTSEAEGGSVRVEYGPLPGLAPADSTATPDQPIPEPLDEPVPIADVTFGVILGPSIAVEQADEAWRDISVRLGSLLLGLDPLVVADVESDGQRLVAGPFDDLASASEMCIRLERVSVACQPAPYAGVALQQTIDSPQ